MEGIKQLIRSTSPLTLLITGLSIVYAIGLFNHALIPSMEPRFAEVISEMMAAGEYLIPIKNGIPYVEYPPLLYWLAIIFVKLGLPVEAAIRLPCYISLIVWILYLSRLQTLLFRKWPAHIMPILGAALPAILWHFFTAQTDPLLITGVLVSFVGFTALRLGQNCGHFPWSLWLGIALASAAKGPVGIACTLPAMMLEILLASVFNRQAGTAGSAFMFDFLIQLKSLAWVRGLLLLLLTLIPWYLASAYYYGWDYIRAVFVYQNFGRYLSGFGGHEQPWWYHFQSVLVGLLPLSIFIPAGLWAVLKKLDKFPQRLVFSWAVYTFLFFSLSVSKQGKYILPAAPAFLALGIFGLASLSKLPLEHSIKRFRVWAVALMLFWSTAVVIFLPLYSGHIAHVDGFAVIKNSMARQPGNLVHFKWPRSLTLYELGAPMDYVKSSRELYQKIHSGAINEGDYLLVGDADLPGPDETDLTATGKLIPFPSAPWFEHVLTVNAKEKVQLFRVLPGASRLAVPNTPEFAPVNWRDAKFDTD
ncbi:MAG: hypothetical protein WBS20_08425 [Lysobacterales bacterium]